MPNNFYYDIIEEKEMPLLDSNCLESNSIYTCTTCDTNYELSNYY